MAWSRSHNCGGKPNGFWPGVWWERMCRQAGWRCTYCGRRTHDLSPDHVRALAKGGTNEWRNIVPACPQCQLRKGARPFMALLPLWDFLDVYFELHPDQYEVYQALGDGTSETEGDASTSEKEEAEAKAA